MPFAVFYQKYDSDEAQAIKSDTEQPNSFPPRPLRPLRLCENIPCIHLDSESDEIEASYRAIRPIYQSDDVASRLKTSIQVRYYPLEIQKSQFIRPKS